MPWHPHGGNGVPVSRAARGPAAAQKKYDPGASDSEIKLGQTMPYSGPLSGFITLGQGRDRLFPDDQRSGRRERAQDHHDLARRRFQPAQDGRADAPAGRAGPGAGRSPARSARATNAAVQKYLNTKKVPQLFLATGASRWNDPEELPLHHDADADLSGRGAHLRRLHAEGGEGSQGRRALPERRFRQGFPERLPRSPGRQGGSDHGRAR